MPYKCPYERKTEGDYTEVEEAPWPQRPRPE